MDAYNVCEECRAVGADYHYDDNGELVCSCYKCPHEDTDDI